MWENNFFISKILSNKIYFKKKKKFVSIVTLKMTLVLVEQGFSLIFDLETRYFSYHCILFFDFTNIFVLSCFLDLKLFQCLPHPSLC